MKIVVDTNVLISGIFWKGPPFEVLNLWKRKQIVLLVSPEIIDEYYKTATEIALKYKISNIDSILNSILSNSEICSSIPLPEQICEDLDDDKFIACALSGHAKFIVTGDKKLLKVSEYEDVKIIRPSDFVKRYFKGKNGKKKVK